MILLYFIFIAHKRFEIEISQSNTTVQVKSYTDYNLEHILNSSLIFIGGYARSGTTLMRALLDVHESVSCGPETKILPALLRFLTEFKASNANKEDLENAFFKNNTIDSALGLFVYHILREHIKNTDRLCAKDPDILYFMEYLHHIFPNSKFIFMIRDPRGAVASLMSRINEPLESSRVDLFLRSWHDYHAIVQMQCGIIGNKYCKVVRYEDLVLNLKEKTKEISDFLNITWTENFLNHEKFVNSKIKISKTEWSSDQIKKAVYFDALKNWQDKFNFTKEIMDPYLSIMSDYGYSF